MASMREVAEKTIRNAKKVWEEVDQLQKSGKISEERAKQRKARAHKAAESARASQGYSGGSDGSERNATKRSSYTYVDGKNKKITSNTNEFANKKTGEYDVDRRDRRTNRKVSYDKRGRDDAGENKIEKVYSTPSRSTEVYNNIKNNSSVNNGGASGGTSGDMSEADMKKIAEFKKGYENASNVYDDPNKVKQAQDYFRSQAEKIRSNYGFSGGKDGSENNKLDNSDDFKSATVEKPSFNSPGGTSPGLDDNNEKTTMGTETKGGQYDHPDEFSAETKSQIDALGKQWMEVDAQEKAGEISSQEAQQLKDKFHSEAEALRNNVGYTGGASGNEYQRLGNTDELSGNQPGEWVELPDGGQAMYDENGELTGYRNPDMSPETEAMINNINRQLDEAKSDQEFYRNAMQELTQNQGTEVDILSYEEALEQAKDQINPIYEKGMNDFMEQTDRNSVRRGVFNQVPTEAFKRYKASEIQNEKSAQISSLAQNLRGQSVNEANQSKQLAMQETQNKLNVLMAGLQASGQSNAQVMNALQIIGNLRTQDRQLRNQEENTEWEKGMAEENQDFNQKISMAQLTGTIDDEDTMAKKQFDFNKDVTNQQLSQTWSRISNDSQSLQQAQQRLGLSYRQQDLSEKQFKLGVQNQAYQMTKEQLASDNPQFDPTVYNALAEQDRQTNAETVSEPGDPSYSNESTRYLDSIMNQSTEEISKEEFESLYEQNINKINGELDTLSDYQN